MGNNRFKNISGLKKVFWDTLNNPRKVSINLLKESDLMGYEINGNVILVIKIPRAPKEVRPIDSFAYFNKKV